MRRAAIRPLPERKRARAAGGLSRGLTGTGRAALGGVWAAPQLCRTASRRDGTLRSIACAVS